MKTHAGQMTLMKKHNVPEIGKLIEEMRASGSLNDEIAEHLNAAGWTTKTGKLWIGATVSKFALEILGVERRCEVYTKGPRETYATNVRASETLLISEVCTSNLSETSKMQIIKRLTGGAE